MYDPFAAGIRTCRPSKLMIPFRSTITSCISTFPILLCTFNKTHCWILMDIFEEPPFSFLPRVFALFHFWSIAYYMFPEYISSLCSLSNESSMALHFFLMNRHSYRGSNIPNWTEWRRLYLQLSHLPFCGQECSENDLSICPTVFDRIQYEESQAYWHSSSF